jgi:hypothetical protein
MDQLIRRWEEAERRLYPSMVTQPEVVADYLRLVREVADDLRTIDTEEGLADAWGRAAELAEAAARREGMAREAPDLEIVAGAAFAIRHRELVAEAGRRETARRIADARARGDVWVVLHEAGMAEAPFPTPYRRLEMRLADGYALHLFAELDADSGRIVHAVEGLRLDPSTGAMAASAEPSRREFADRQEWLAAVQALRESGPKASG